ncbi:MAG: 3-oxoacyl-[acyl-carrier-protein] reductase [Planctomycetes bacterium]|nr:3-oxoacyl-[acyl-carrier-protein] reductase [Planctomycetota bacterium]
MSLRDQVAIVTGASRGIGRAIAVRLAREGVRIAGLARTRETLEETARQVESAGGKMTLYPCDIAETGPVATAIEEIARTWSRVDLLVNNAGITRDNLLLRMKPEDWDLVIQTNLKGAFNTCRAVLRPMLKQKYGRIINITSVVGVVGWPGQTNYAASKAGLIGFTKSLAKEVASRNITVNAVAPGFIVTDMTSNLSEEIRSEALKTIPLQRFGQAEEIAEAVVFLASDSSSYITGQVLQVDGGLAM